MLALPVGLVTGEQFLTAVQRELLNEGASFLQAVEPPHVACKEASTWDMEGIYQKIAGYKDV